MKATFWNFLAHEGDFGVILGPLWAYKRRMAGMMRVVAGLMVSLSAPSGPISRKYKFLPRILLFKEATKVPEKVCNGAGRTVWEEVGGG